MVHEVLRRVVAGVLTARCRIFAIPPRSSACRALWTCASRVCLDVERGAASDADALSVTAWGGKTGSRKSWYWFDV